MINYRNLKRLLGETSLERKCRFLFGIALLLLISGSFWLDAARTRQLVENQQVATAGTLVPQLLWQRHYQRRLQQELGHRRETTDSTSDQQSASAATPSEEPADSPDVNAAPSNGPADQSQLAADLQADTGNESAAGNSDQPRSNSLVADTDKRSAVSERYAEFEERLTLASELGTGLESNLILQWNLILKSDEYPNEDQGFDAMTQFRNKTQESVHHFSETEDGERVLKYYEGIRASQSCLVCHNGRDAAAYEDDEYVAMASITLSMANVEWQLSRNRAILLASAIMTTFLAMLAAYAIVRYIIVKPVLHLKDVSDEIALGNLNLRAEITTGDEFEELSHAFNRMLRHMTTVNDELRGLNDDLDAKVDQLAQANMELFNSNKLKDDFLATMSHELRTPLNSILGFSDILAGAENLNDRQRRYVDNIRTSGRNLMVQINDLLDLAKIEGGQMELQVGNVVARDLIDAQVQQIMPLADQKNIELRVTHPDPPMPELQQDGGKIRQILTNLLSNAIKFTPEGGRVRVSSRMLNDDEFEICVEDTGIGIPLHEQENIFEKFRQGSTLPGQRDHAKREYGGTGLGLSIVRELARLMGGDVHLESEFGKGSLFQLHLPVCAEPDGPAARKNADSIGKSLSRITTVDLLNQPPPPAADTDQDGDEDDQVPATDSVTR